MSKTQKTKHNIAIQVRWFKPPVDCFKLNSDGATLGNPGKAGGGGLIWIHQGKWVKGYMRHIGFASSIIAEFWALKDGLLLTSQLGISKLLVELDAQLWSTFFTLPSLTITPFLFCLMIAGSSFVSSSKSGSTMPFEKRIDVQIILLKEVAPLMGILLF